MLTEQSTITLPRSSTFESAYSSTLTPENLTQKLENKIQLTESIITALQMQLKSTDSFKTFEVQNSIFRYKILIDLLKIVQQNPENYPDINIDEIYELVKNDDFSLKNSDEYQSLSGDSITLFSRGVVAKGGDFDPPFFTDQGNPQSGINGAIRSLALSILANSDLVRNRLVRYTSGNIYKFTNQDTGKSPSYADTTASMADSLARQIPVGIESTTTQETIGEIVEAINNFAESNTKNSSTAWILSRDHTPRTMVMYALIRSLRPHENVEKLNREIYEKVSADPLLGEVRNLISDPKSMASFLNSIEEGNRTKTISNIEKVKLLLNDDLQVLTNPQKMHEFGKTMLRNMNHKFTNTSDLQKALADLKAGKSAVWLNDELLKSLEVMNEQNLEVNFINAEDILEETQNPLLQKYTEIAYESPLVINTFLGELAGIYDLLTGQYYKPKTQE